MLRALLASAVTLAATSPAFATLENVYTSYANVEVASVEPLCPQGVTCIANGTVVNLKVSYGCTEKLGRVTAEAIEKDGQLHVYVAAPVVGQGRAACLAITQKLVSFQFISQYGEVELHPLKDQVGQTLK